MDTTTAALYFRFSQPDALPDDVKEYLRANSREVADAMPGSYGQRLFEYLKVDEPSNYTGLDEPRGNEAWKDRLRYQNLRVARGELTKP